MNFYLIQVFIFLCYSVIFYFVNIKNRDGIYCIIVWIHLTLLMGMRSSLVGTDTQMYVNGYYEANAVKVSADNSTTYVYDFLRKIIAISSNSNYHVFLMVLSAISVGCFLFFVYKISSNYFEEFMSIYIYISYYYYFNSFDIQRQMLAVSLSMLSAYFIINDKKTLSILALLLAIGVHNTAFVCAIYYIVWHYQRGEKEFYITTFLALISLMFMDKVLSIFSNFSDHYSMYENSLDSYGANGGTILLGVFFLLVTICTLHIISKSTVPNNALLFLIYLVGIGSTLYIVGAKQQLLIRMADYFCIYSSVLLPKSVEIISSKFKGRGAYLALSITVIVVGLVILVYKLSKNMGMIIPYA